MSHYDQRAAVTLDLMAKRLRGLRAAEPDAWPSIFKAMGDDQTYIAIIHAEPRDESRIILPHDYARRRAESS